jgi:hypothetical protein
MGIYPQQSRLNFLSNDVNIMEIGENIREGGDFQNKF